MISLPSEENPSKMTTLSRLDNGGNYTTIFQKRRILELRKRSGAEHNNIENEIASRKDTYNATGKTLSVNKTIENELSVANEEEEPQG